ncbi:pep-cterm sorting domain-containing protein [Anaeramoeba flamelloides]|uniref:Pep-cterm sorting domain-containing protein n=1 Tax=Anaeramoeba flamelloides TaxID=1746091 RepID=A0AAV7YH29_9EUKA|nr:pep-cterm sorting domain-containing protein [Anaeramoeba flamelloides]
MMFQLRKAGANFNNKLSSLIKKSTIKKDLFVEIAEINFNSLNEDFKKYFNQSEFTNFQITNDINVHKLIIELRTGMSADGFKTVLLNNDFTKEQNLSFLKWIYSGYDLNQKNIKAEQTMINEIATKLKISKELYQKSLKESLNELLNDESTKDYTIIVQSKPIKVHKIVLQARSELYRGMFTSTNNNPKENNHQIHDYSGKSYQAVLLLIKYLYLGEIDLTNLSEKIIEELEDCADYYGLNPKCSFEYDLMFR